MSLKRLLNSSPDQIGHSFPIRQPQLGWDYNGAATDAEPVLQDQTWPTLVQELLGETHAFEPHGQPEDVDSDALHPICDAQEQIEQWAATNVYAAKSISPASAPQATASAQETQICYGMIDHVSVRLKGDMVELDHRMSASGSSILEGYHQLTIRELDGDFLVTFPDGGIMGELNAQLGTALLALSGTALDFDVLAPARAIRETIGRTGKEKEAVVRVNINVYGKRDQAQWTGSELSKHRVYLQRPDCLPQGMEYDNPHVLKLRNVQIPQPHISFRADISNGTHLGKADDLKRTVSAVYSSLKRDKALNEKDGDERLVTKLLPHQKEALDFMSQRENGQIPNEFLLWRPEEIDGQPCYRHLITKAISRIHQTEAGGGILADEMGMGKTLSILALIIGTLDVAHKWATSSSIDCVIREPNAVQFPKRTGATLVVASADLMINEWMQEIDRHFDQQTRKSLTVIKYHGPNRENVLAKLRDADIILTTYHTLASDLSGKGNRLDQFEWYRLVLDEAHIIRRQSTTLNKTVSQLKARSRWCLTGTPIQNRLEDIGALFAFLRVNPFQSLATFRKHISIPYEEGGRQRRLAVDSLIQLLDSLCLRRTKDRLHLPHQEERVREVIFSPEEREQYQHTYQSMSRAVRNQVGAGFHHTNTLGMFQVQLALRILCNHGTWQQRYSWKNRRLLDETEAVEMDLGGGAEVTCFLCKETMPRFSAGTIYKHYNFCKHVICYECITDTTSTGTRSNADNDDHFPPRCPFCYPNVQANAVNGSSQSHQPTQILEPEAYFCSQGRSSKMEYLIRDVQENLWTTKSIIFSCWTHTLELIGRYLSMAGIFFGRIDGECPTAKRENIIEDFARNDQLRVLIMTTGTGAVGLNLAMANRVFLVEPQWNPSVEAQAIARALRLGQSQRVQVTRYVVMQTVEQDMKSLQDRKREIAEIARE